MVTTLTMLRPITATLRFGGSGRIDHLLDTVNIGSECRDDDALFRFSENLFQFAADVRLRTCMSGPLRVGAESDSSSKHTASTDFGHPVQVGKLTVNRRMIKLKVASVDDDTFGCMNANSHRIGNAVIRPEKGGFQLAEFDFRIRGDQDPLRIAEHIGFLQLAFHQAQGKPRSVDRNVEMLQNVGQSADMVLVSVCQQNSSDLILHFPSDK